MAEGRSHAFQEIDRAASGEFKRHDAGDRGHQMPDAFGLIESTRLVHDFPQALKFSRRKFRMTHAAPLRSPTEDAPNGGSTKFSLLGTYKPNNV